MQSQLYLFIFTFVFIVAILIPSPISKKIHIQNSNPINGVRGVLASLVMFSHLFKDIYIHQNGAWRFDKNFFEFLSLDNALANTGKIGVAIFFMISGYLFYKLIDKDKINILSFFKNRITRIYPLYFFTILFSAAYLIIESDFAYSAFDLIKTLPWLVFAGQYNAIPIQSVNQGVEWTLKLEILLYTSIPILFYILHDSKSRLFKHSTIVTSIIAIFIAGFLIRIYGKVYIDPRAALCFYVGYLAIDLKKQNILYFLKSNTAAVISILLFISSFFISTYNLYYFYLIFSCGFLFLAISNGNDFFGILRLKKLQTLGEISYSIYLIHGIVLYFLMKIIKLLDITNNIALIIFFITYFYVTFTISSLTFLHIEKRFHKK